MTPRILGVVAVALVLLATGCGGEDAGARVGVAEPADSA